VDVSDFITPHYYDPNGATGVQYSFRGSVKEPHTVLEGGYVSFGNPLDNQWYQIVVENGVVKLRNLGEIKSTRGKSLREIVDRAVRRARKSERYRTKPAVLTAMATGINPRLKETSTGRAKLLREQIKKLK
jgi:hypothetical protein